MNLQSNPGNRLIISERNSGNLVQRDNWDGEPTFETVRADVLKSLSYKPTVPAPSAQQ